MDKFDIGGILCNQNKPASSYKKTYLILNKENADTLLLCFSGAGAVVKFDFYKTFTKHPMCNNIDVMFLGDLNGYFYLGGIAGFSSNFKETVNKINQLCIDKKYKKVIFVGTSMGGFGAILHSILFAEITEILNIKCLIFNPYTILTDLIIRRMKNTVDPKLMFYMLQRGISKEQIYKMIIGLDEKFIDLKTIIKTYNSKNLNKLKIHVVYGNVDREIKMVNRIINFNNLTSEVFEIQEHNIAGKLAELEILHPILENFINS